MRWNPFLTKRGRIISVTVTLFLLPISYLASYPIAYRLLAGPDVSSRRLFSMRGVSAYIELSPEEIRRVEMWWQLQRYYFPLAEWLIDHTSLRSPVLMLAVLVGTDEQVKDDIVEREFNRRLQVLLVTGNRAAIDKLFTDFEPSSCSFSSNR